MNETPPGNGTEEATPRRSLRVYLFRLARFVIMWLVVGFGVGAFHIDHIGFVDTPGGPAITTTHALIAAVANPLGPWAGHVVRLVDFPNAGLGRFNLGAALGMTLLFGMLVGVGIGSELRLIRWTVVVIFAVFLMVWYGYGLVLIADGML